MGKPLIYVVYYSVYGHVRTLAKQSAEAINKSGHATAQLFKVQETLPPAVLEKIHAQKFDDPVLNPMDLPKADGFLFGFPTRYGAPAGQMKSFWDGTGALFAKGSLAGKMGGAFTSTGSQHGGQETTIANFISHYTHHGVIYVPIGYTSNILNDNSELIGGSPWGAGTISGGDGSRKVSEKELELAAHQGRYFAEILSKYHNGKASL
ncbi:NAD(P)H dehydrogenase (quinone) [Synchytrium microbalum]|uniref:NAD(P)H dehydrogenase (Quinone) n=1 Tax=Synchytrium microbalum TaxID=1806994 RepID=A0A507BRN8_9FUNG|nr:NAD(P)H dehydrogenase (quinone) [Synchytrium microbalum]TPX31787.1 NAD(P)H dehydrogenase (quinone) [Synchytrium microbalum]